MIGPPAIQPILLALALPERALVNQRVPKKTLLEQGMPTAADKRAVQDGLDELWWVAALKPATTGLAAYTDDARDYAEVAVLALVLRPAAKATRLVELVHRAIPYPVVLATAQGHNAWLSMAHKRASQAEKEGWVVDELRSTPPLAADAAYLNAFALQAQAASDLGQLYRNWLACIEATQAERLTGRFKVPANVQETHLLRQAMDTVATLERELAQLRVQAKREKQLNKAVKLNLAIKKCEAEVVAIKNALSA
jgi:hypothetical protein